MYHLNNEAGCVEEVHDVALLPGEDAAHASPARTEEHWDCLWTDLGGEG